MAFTIGAVSTACAVGALITTTALDLRSLLSLGIAMILVLLSIFSGALAYLLFVPLRRTSLRVSGFSVSVGSQRTSAAQLRTIWIEDEHIVLETTGGRIQIPASEVPVAERRWICHQIQALRSGWEALEGPVPTEVRHLVEQIDGR